MSVLRLTPSNVVFPHVGFPGVDVLAFHNDFGRPRLALRVVRDVAFRVDFRLHRLDHGRRGV